MDSWTRALRAAVASGSVAGVLSGVMLALCGWRERRRPAAPANAVSHWLWGDEAIHRRRADGRHTLIGYGIHHGASIFWATFYERWLGARPPARRALGVAAGVAALACLVDLKLTPRRFTPGFERQLSPASLALVYAAFAAGLAAPHLLSSGTPAPARARAAGAPAPRAAPAVRSPSRLR